MNNNPPPPQALPSKPRKKGRYRNVPLRDENGKLRGIIEISKEVPPPEQRARFKSLARMLHQIWFIDQPSPLWVDGKPPAPLSPWLDEGTSASVTTTEHP